MFQPSWRGKINLQNGLYYSNIKNTTKNSYEKSTENTKTENTKTENTINIDNNNDVIEEPVEEHIVEVKEDEIQPEEVEKKNDIQFETGENYKVLNYLKRDA